MDEGGFKGLMTTDLSKVFNSIDHELLIAKRHVYGFDIKSFKFIDCYLAGRKRRVKITLSFSEWSEIHYGVPQGSTYTRNFQMEKVIETLDKITEKLFQ